MNEIEASADILYELLSDPFAIKVKLGLDKVCIPYASKTNDKQAHPGRRCKSTYFSDKQVKGWNTFIRKAQSQWSKDPTDTRSWSAMLQIAGCTTENLKHELINKWSHAFSVVSLPDTIQERLRSCQFNRRHLLMHRFNLWMIMCANY
ncbi:hypothetical protein SK128_010454 [Halocaridina rubra]|uniref:Uncharacterized protein n=1 Tax=Halocaridina rubra TaxID=373956 RepID=A0AAN8XPK4_HALRR